MASVEPYTISVPEAKVERLAQKLDTVEFPDELEGADWDYGAPLADVKRLTQYWKEKFNWKAQETKLNKLPQFHTDIQVDGFESLDIHFVHQKSDVEGAIPLLFSHGCLFPILGRISQANDDRAWQLYRSHQNPPTACQRRQRRSRLPCCCPIPTKLWIFIWDQEERFWLASVCRDLSQVDAEAGIR